jgi:tRNA threonylcarbamoyladenosine biosynthesis protein TsaB
MDGYRTRYVLGLDTGGDHISVGLARLNFFQAERERDATGLHVVRDEVIEDLVVERDAARRDSALRLVHEVLLRHGLTASALGLIAVGRGPGGFTGIRLGLSLALGLSLGAGIPVWPVCSLAVLALNAEEGLAMPLLDARKGEVYGALFRVRCGLPEVLLAPAVGTCESVLALGRASAQALVGEGMNPVVLGSGAVAHGVETTQVPATHVPRGAMTALLGAAQWRAAGFDATLAPPLDAVYLRRPEAEIALDGP